jgi:hypothetical protein
VKCWITFIAWMIIVFRRSILSGNKKQKLSSINDFIVKGLSINILINYLSNIDDSKNNYRGSYNLIHYIN